ncbi:hypothetical protein [Acidilobus sp.]|uniref:hypothetical protein n=1 Tax=Acidilobus sp. TaxID=1872109 RepID=UPI003D064BFE
METRSIVRPAVCPSCGALGEYHYEVSGPVVRDGQAFIEVKHHFRCEACGHVEEGTVYVPLEGLYRLRYLLVPEAMAVVEKAKLVSELSPEVKGLAAAGTG